MHFIHKRDFLIASCRFLVFTRSTNNIPLGHPSFSAVEKYSQTIKFDMFKKNERKMHYVILPFFLGQATVELNCTSLMAVAWLFVIEIRIIRIFTLLTQFSQHPVYFYKWQGSAPPRMICFYWINPNQLIFITWHDLHSSLVWRC